MESHLQRKHPYQSNLADLTLVTGDTVPPLYRQKKNDPSQKQQHRQHSLSLPTRGSQLHCQNQQAGGSKLHTEDTYSDSDYELDNAPIQSASRVTRRLPVKIPFLNSSTSLSSLPSRQISKNKLESSSHFYSTVIEPEMNLGQRWPARSSTFKKVVLGDRWHSVMTNKIDKISLLKQMTTRLVDTYEKQNSEYQYKSTNIPKRVLTKPSKAAKNDGFDNDDYDFILKVDDILGEEKGYQYRVINLLGIGTFGQVVKCERITTGELFSVKIIKNKVAYREQSRMEVEILKQLKSKLDSKGKQHILTLHHTFTYKNHFCLVFELLSFNLYELIKQNLFKGLSINLVRVFTLQLLDTLILLKEAKIIHCDLKPENILLTSFDTPIIKVIDFGSACHEANKIYTYIQSRFYRSPEVLLGLQYTGAIDMWSAGCIVAELFLGIPLFPGNSEYNQLRRIIDMLGMPPQDMLDKGLNSEDFFNKESKGNDNYTYTMKSLEQYGMEHKKTELPGKKYYAQTELPDLILQAKSHQRPQENPKQDLVQRRSMIDFLQGLLELNPLKRWTPQQARYHPFVTGEPFIEAYNPNNLARKLGSTAKRSHYPTALPSSTSSGNPVMDANTFNPPATKFNGSTHQLPLEERQRSSIDTMQSLEIAQHVKTTNSPHRPRAQSMNTPTLPNQVHRLALDMKAHPIVEHHPIEQQQDQAKLNNGTTTPRSGYKHRHSRSQGDLVGLLSPEKHWKTAFQQDGLSGGRSSVPSSLQQEQQPANTNTFTNYNTSTSDDHNSIDNTTIRLASQHSSVLRKVTIAPNVKIRVGSREAYRQSGSGTNKMMELSSTKPKNSSNGDWLVEPTISSSSRPKPKGRFPHEGEAAGGLLMMRQEKNELFGSTSTISNGKYGEATTRRRTMHGN
ncbi:unnamed protein product [Absidia cylindrospora]